MKTVIDLSHTIFHNMPVCSDDQSPCLEQIAFIQKQTFANFQLTTEMHVGTHVDGSLHMIEDGLFLSQVPIDRFVGGGVLIDARDKLITRDLLQGINFEPGCIVLVLTGYDKKFGSKEYFTNHAVFSLDFARELVARKVKMVGVDMPGPDKLPFDIHKMFFRHNIMIIENLTGLGQLIGVACFEVYALPLKINADSALARVIAVY